MSDSDDTSDLCEGEINSNPNKRFKAVFKMSEGLIALFEDFMLRNEYEEALNVVSESYGIAPTSFLISEIIFKIMMTCNERLCYDAFEYLEESLKSMPTDDDHKYVFIEGLKSKTSPFEDAWGAFSHFVLSSLHHRNIDGNASRHEYVKYPNCDYLVQIYVNVFKKGPFKSTVFGSQSNEKFSALVKWINVFYKYNAIDEVLKSLHSLLDHIFELELSYDPAIPKWAAIHTAPLSKYILILLNKCKDVFRLENQQKFFIFTDSPYLILKICKQRLDDMLEKASVTRNPVVTLNSIVKDYFFDPKSPRVVPKSEPMKAGKFSGNSGRKRKHGTPSTSPLSAKLKPGRKHKGDTEFHICCRSDRFDNLLEALYADKLKDINTPNCLGMTPLHEACLVGSYLCCKFLIEDAGVRVVDFRAVDNEGRTPLHFAVHKKALDVVKLLLKRGGSDLVKYFDNTGKKPIDYSESEEITKILQEIESQLEPSDDEPEKSDDPLLQKLPKLKNPKNLPLYLRTLRSLIGSYCDIYDLPKDKSKGDVKILLHAEEDCCHYKAPPVGTLCIDDLVILSSMAENIKTLSACAKSISTDDVMAKETRSLDILAARFV